MWGNNYAIDCETQRFTPIQIIQGNHKRLANDYWIAGFYSQVNLNTLPPQYYCYYGEANYPNNIPSPTQIYKSKALATANGQCDMILISDTPLMSDYEVTTKLTLCGRFDFHTMESIFAHNKFHYHDRAITFDIKTIRQSLGLAEKCPSMMEEQHWLPQHDRLILLQIDSIDYNFS